MACRLVSTAICAAALLTVSLFAGENPLWLRRDFTAEGVERVSRDQEFLFVKPFVAYRQKEVNEPYRDPPTIITTVTYVVEYDDYGKPQGSSSVIKLLTWHHRCVDFLGDRFPVWDWRDSVHRFEPKTPMWYTNVYSTLSYFTNDAAVAHGSSDAHRVITSITPVATNAVEYLGKLKTRVSVTEVVRLGVPGLSAGNLPCTFSGLTELTGTQTNSAIVIPTGFDGYVRYVVNTVSNTISFSRLYPEELPYAR